MIMITTKKRNDNPLNVFEDVFGTLFNDSVGALAKAAQTGSWTPAVDIVESTDAYTLTADLPGLTKGRCSPHGGGWCADPIRRAKERAQREQRVWSSLRTCLRQVQSLVPIGERD